MRERFAEETDEVKKQVDEHRRRVIDAPSHKKNKHFQQYVTHLLIRKLFVVLTNI